MHSTRLGFCQWEPEAAWPRAGRVATWKVLASRPTSRAAGGGPPGSGSQILIGKRGGGGLGLRAGRSPMVVSDTGGGIPRVRPVSCLNRNRDSRITVRFGRSSGFRMMRGPDTEGRRPPQVRKLYCKCKLGCSLLVQSTQCALSDCPTQPIASSVACATHHPCQCIIASSWDVRADCKHRGANPAALRSPALTANVVQPSVLGLHRHVVVDGREVDVRADRLADEFGLLRLEPTAERIPRHAKVTNSSTRNGNKSINSQDGMMMDDDNNNNKTITIIKLRH